MAPSQSPSRSFSRRSHAPVPFLPFCFSVLPFTLPAQNTKAPAAKAPPSAASATPVAIDLPVRKVVLYKNGVGYFEHAGTVNGNQRVTVDFTSTQLNDVLQSLTALDSKGGTIGAVGYNSTMPIQQQLNTLALGLKDMPATLDVYRALRGQRVEVTGSGAAARPARQHRIPQGNRQERPNLRRPLLPHPRNRHRRAAHRRTHRRRLGTHDRSHARKTVRIVSRNHCFGARSAVAPSDPRRPRPGRAPVASQLHQRGAGLEVHLSHRLPTRPQRQRHPARMGRRGQHRRRGLGQRAAVAGSRRAAELHPAALAAALHPAADDSDRNRGAECAHHA